MTPKQKIPPRVFFDSFIHKIEIEISAACNRGCDYCPQSVVRRPQQLMPLELFEKIVLELKELEYSRELAFHQYNEPLLAAEHFFNCDTLVSAHLPRAKKVLHTNGDYLTKEILDELAASKFSLISVSLHLDPGEAWTWAGSVRKIKNFAEQVKILDVAGIDSLKNERNAPIPISAKLNEGTLLHVITPNFSESGSSRVGAVSIEGGKKKKSKICPYILHQLNVAYEGSSYICCDCCHDFPPHARYVVGSARENTMLELFARKFNIYTQSYLFGELPEACRICQGVEQA